MISFTELVAQKKKLSRANVVAKYLANTMKEIDFLLYSLYKEEDLAFGIIALKNSIDYPISNENGHYRIDFETMFAKLVNIRPCENNTLSEIKESFFNTEMYQKDKKKNIILKASLPNSEKK